MSEDLRWMEHALVLARQAQHAGEVPVGAVLVKDQEILGEGWNQPILKHDPSAHAEIVALRAAGQRLGNYRLLGATLYVTLEPCLMCVGSLVHARIQRLVFGARDPKAGAVVSAFQLLDHASLNHRVGWQEGPLAEDCGRLLTDFFMAKRALK